LTLTSYTQAAHVVLPTGKNSQKYTAPSFAKYDVNVYSMGHIQCYAQTDNPSECRPQGDDYIECLFHHREVCLASTCCHTSVPVTHSSYQIERAKQVKAEFIRKAEYQAKEGRKAADVLADGVIVGVGLIRRGKGNDAGAAKEKSG
jgi:NADH dehydrogenase (ubiquinone) Fe-S protein 5